MRCPTCDYEFEPTGELQCPRCGQTLNCTGVSCENCDACTGIFEQLRRKASAIRTSGDD